MNKGELIKKVADEIDFSQKDVTTVYTALIDAITDALKAGDKVQLAGFGSFEVKERAERKGRNPKTKEQITIPAAKYPAFSASKSLKESVNK